MLKISFTIKQIKTKIKSHNEVNFVDKSDDQLSQKQKELIEFLEKSKTQNSKSKKYEFENNKEQLIHLNSLITKNISLITKDPNYKLLAWLLVQLTIFSLFIFAVSIMKNTLLPYINSL